MADAIKEFIRKGKDIYKKLGRIGALEELQAYLKAEGPKGDPRVYGWISALDEMIDGDLPSPAAMMDAIRSDEGLDDETFWAEFFARYHNGDEGE